MPGHSRGVNITCVVGLKFFFQRTQFNYLVCIVGYRYDVEVFITVFAERDGHSVI